MTKDAEDDFKKFLLSIVDNPHSDYDESIDGYANYWVKDDILTVTFEDDDMAVKAKWKLTLIDIKTELVEDDE